MGLKLWSWKSHQLFYLMFVCCTLSIIRKQLQLVITWILEPWNYIYMHMVDQWSFMVEGLSFHDHLYVIILLDHHILPAHSNYVNGFGFTSLSLCSLKPYFGINNLKLCLMFLAGRELYWWLYMCSLIGSTYQCGKILNFA